MAGEKNLVTLRDVLYVFFKNKTIITIVLLVAVIGALIYCIVTPPKYRAETKILVRIGKAQASGVENYPERPNILFQERTQNIRNEMELLRGEYLSEKVVERLKDKISAESTQPSLIARARDEIKAALYRMGLSKRTVTDRAMVTTFMNAMSVSYLEDTDMIKLTFDWTDPKIAALVANTYADEYISQHAAVYDSQRSYRFYIDQIDQSEKKLKDAENELQEFTVKGSIANIELQKDLLLRNIGDLTTRYNLVSVDYAQALAKMKQIKDMIARPGAWVETPEGATGTTGAGADKQGYLRTLDEAYFKLRVERERMLKSYTPVSNEIRTLDVQLANLKKQKGDSLINIAGMELALAENKRNSLQKEISTENAKLESINSKTITLKQLQRQKDIVEANYQLYKKKAEDFRISDDLDAKKISAVKVVAPAIPPLHPAYPKKALTMVMAAFIGLFFGFGFSAVREFFNHTFKDDGNIQTYLGIPLLLTVSFHGRREDQGFLAGLVRTGNSVRARFSPNFARSNPVPGPATMQRMNGLVLLLVSLTTIMLSGYFYYDAHQVAEGRRMAAADGVALVGEKYLAQGPITVQAADEVAMKLTTLSLPEAEAAKETSQPLVTPPVQAQRGTEEPVRPSLLLQQTDKVKAVAALKSENGKSASTLRAQEGNEALREHTVARGETLVKILRFVYHVPDESIFNESLELVAAANPNTRNLKSLHEGQKIFIPQEVIEKGLGSDKKN